MPGDGEKYKFLQIRHIDANQEALERRMESVIGGDVLNSETLRSMTRLPYFKIVNLMLELSKPTDNVLRKPRRLTLTRSPTKSYQCRQL